MKEIKKQKIYLIILIATVLVAVISGTYSWLMLGGIRTGNGISFGTTTASGATFTSYAEGNIVLDINNEMMTQEYVGSLKNASSKVYVILEGGVNELSTTCSYDLVWVWDSEDQYKESSVPLPFVGSDGNIYPYEFSVKIGGNEKNLSSLEWQDNKAVIFSKSISASKGEIVNEEYEIEVNIYNIPTNQVQISRKSLYGHIEVTSPHCNIASTIAGAAQGENTMGQSVKNIYNGQGSVSGNGKLFLQNNTIDNSINDNSYRYTGANPNNFLCFQGDDCTDPDNLFRIIGIFNNNLKVIKYTSIGNMRFNSEANSWEDSNLDIYLNSTWIDSLGNKANLIKEEKWYVNGFASSANTAKAVSSSELTGKTITRKVGLMYASDYGFATDNSFWNVNLYDYQMQAKNTNWMYDSTYNQWTMTKTTADTANAFRISTYGDLRANPVSEENAVRPVFYIKEGIKYVSGNGSESEPIVIADWPAAQEIKSKYLAQGTEVGNGKLFLHDSTLENGAEDNSYRYSGANPDNYVCFKGYDCSNKDNLYRIIGVFDNKVKLVKYTAVDTTDWNSSNSNTWNGSSIESFLNSTWLNAINNNLIPLSVESNDWYTGGISNWDVNRNVSGYYAMETDGTTTNQKVGLIYPSDYGYAIDNSYWDTSMNNYKLVAQNQNWLIDLSGTQWTMSSVSSTSNNVFHIDEFGDLYYSDANVEHIIRPTFYLKERMLIESGNGRLDNPYILRAEDTEVTVENINTFANTIKLLYTSQGTASGNGKIYLHDGTLANGAGDNSYRYSGANPNNYVCFGGDACTNANNLYRIIGLFDDRVKLIKNASIGNRQWNSSALNTWDNSALEKYINGEWFVTLGTKSNLISNSVWSVGGYNGYSVTPKEMYINETNNSTAIKRNIGLMYVSDYGFAADNKYWSTNLYDYESSKEKNWMLVSTGVNEKEWTISRFSGNINTAFFVTSDGNVYRGGSLTNVTDRFIVRPTFYLKKFVEIKKGNGTSTNPYIIELNN